MSTPYLLIDAGNSRVKWALVQADGTQTHSGAFSHGGQLVKGTGDPLQSRHEPDWSALPAPGSAWLSNVAGDAVARRIDAFIDRHWPGLARTTVRSAAQQCGVTNAYTTPSQLGSDRWAGMIGARAAFPGEPLLIATFGTATTLEALTADGVFVGGLIAPGWSLMMRSLGEHTAQLPTLDSTAARGLLDGDNAAGQREPAERGAWFATDTPRSLSSGCALAQIGLIERMWRHLQDEWQVSVRLVVGGGAAGELVQALSVPYTRHDSLVLAGLALIAAQAPVYPSTHTRPV
ncbi:type III pantothenate kinase [Paraburkholderia phymatum]|uniref:Type III pantothenate kinase n=1 Tax=Paraburkholderia phymatum (strain DSM 17167 / CIP 108236 / LMG 21445 / STM815) TaxID=391038 RepID=COAX_PARP8|nr:type III pantothenate kinase [Paraburkholderia phymatum]B2JKK7.1 RecName: Full=Type III pantothenate kinase; AltName: Full=PanK-III; AltName: Full=Pantothenic acid kinase [Paraburkholderia phymatum STM815]ACC69396.1 putative transcriptional acitvator, Baf family [Paraburkholderia phymatum STM815]